MLNFYTIGKLIKDYRKEILKISNQEKFAQLVGVSHSTIKNWELKKDILDPHGSNLPQWIFHNKQARAYFDQMMQEVQKKQYLESSISYTDADAALDYISDKSAPHNVNSQEKGSNVSNVGDYLVVYNVRGYWERLHKKTMKPEIEINGEWVAKATLH